MGARDPLELGGPPLRPQLCPGACPPLPADRGHLAGVWALSMGR